MSKVTTVIFDMYETLVHNGRELWIDTFRNVCHAQGLTVDPEILYSEWKSLEMVIRKERLNLEQPAKSLPFKSYEHAWRDCFTDAFSRLGLKGDAGAAAEEAVRDLGLREPYEDAVEVLPVVQSRWKTAMLSNADDKFLYPLVSRLRWRFDAALTSERIRAYKPLPSPFRAIMDELGVAAEEAIYVGDSLYDDILGARGVGMRAAWVNRNGAAADPELPRPDYEVGSLRELPDILESIS